MFHGLLNIEGIWVQHRVSPEPFNLSLWNFHKMSLIYKTFIWTNNKKDSHVTLSGHFESHIENMKMPINNYFMQNNRKTSIYIKYQSSGFILIYCFIRNKSKYSNWRAVCHPHGHVFDIFCFPRNLMTLQILQLVQKIALTSIYDIIMSPEHFEIKNTDLRPK